MTKNNIKRTSIVLAIAAAIILPTMAFSSVNANTTDELTRIFDQTFTQKGAYDQSVEDKMMVVNNINNGEITEYPYPEERQIAMDRALSLILQIQTASSPEQKAHLESLLEDHKPEMLKYGLVAITDLEGPDGDKWLQDMREANLQNKEFHSNIPTETIGNFLLPFAFATGSHTDDWYVTNEIKYFENGFIATFETENEWDHANGSGYFWFYHNIVLPDYLWSDQVDGVHTVSNFDHSQNPHTPDTYSYMSIYNDQNSQLRVSCYDDRYWTIYHNNFKEWTYCSSSGDGVDEDDLVYSSLKVDDI